MTAFKPTRLKRFLGVLLFLSLLGLSVFSMYEAYLAKTQQLSNYSFVNYDSAPDLDLASLAAAVEYATWDQERLIAMKSYEHGLSASLTENPYDAVLWHRLTWLLAQHGDLRSIERAKSFYITYFRANQGPINAHRSF